MENQGNNLAQFSYFKKPASNTLPSETFTLLDTYNYIIGDNAKEATEKLRSISDVPTAKQFKKYNFDYCTFSGTFTSRADKNLTAHSSLLCLDFDHLKNLDKLRAQLLEDEYFDSQLLFRSPSGNGLKWIIEIDLSKASREDLRIAAGVSPRGSIALYKACQAYAAVNGRTFVTPEDVKLLALPVFRKRIILTSDSLLKGYDADKIIRDLILQVPIPAFKAHV